ncbi:MAG: glutathione S-transferase family protein [Burkholderiales bacterium]|nr:glutathione S-transferase family protein [Burkholderiales bacterium]
MAEADGAPEQAAGQEPAPLTFYFASGSPFSWKVWLALEHKELPYVPWQMSLDAGDLRAPAYAAINPHRQVPVIVDDGFTLYESAAIVEYLEDRYPRRGEPLWPAAPRERALARRLAAEADNSVFPPVDLLMRAHLGGAGPDADADRQARATLAAALDIVARGVIGPFAAGALPSAADFALYPMLALLLRIDARAPQAALAALVPERLRTWMNIVAALPYYERTYPPHWRA